MNPAVKRALWCRWFHRWHPHRAPSITSRDPSGSGASLVLHGLSFGRTSCDACQGTDYGRAYRKWLAS